MKRELSLLERALKKSGWRGPRETGAQRLKYVLDRGRKEREERGHGGQKGYGTCKRVSGIKRHIVVDTQGLPHAVAVMTAEVTDHKGALQAFERCKAGLGQVQSVLADSGYVGRPPKAYRQFWANT